MTSRLAVLATAASTALLGAMAVLPTTQSALAAAPAAVQTIDGCLASVPEPGQTDKVDICFTIFRPAKATKKHKVPMIIHSHGWGGSRTTDAASFKAFTDAGYGVLSFDQRGFGASGGKAHVENPDFEGHDVRALITKIASLNWVKKDAKGDPRMGAIGGSYGGGYQFLAAFESLRLNGKPIIDAMAPEITWNDLKTSLAPSGVVRTEWAALLATVALPTEALPEEIYLALAEGAALGTWPDGTIPGLENLDPFFEKNGPKWHIGQGRRLDIPMLFGQGMTDGLFNAQQGLTNWSTALTRKARKQSIFVGYNGGHVLPAVYPLGTTASGDPCSKALAGGSFQQLTIRFFDEKLRGRKTGLTGYGRIHLATPDDGCVTTKTAAPTKVVDLGTVVAQTGQAGPAIGTVVASGPITIAGSASFTATVTAAGIDDRTFAGLAVGTSPATANLIQSNVMPVRVQGPVVGETMTFELPAVAVEVPAGQSLYLLFSPTSETFASMGSRAPGVIAFEDVKLHLPVR